MRISRRTGGMAVAGAMLAAGTVAYGIAQPDSAAASPPAKSRSQVPVHTVTLITGDVVTISGADGPATAQAGPGRAGVIFSVETVGGHVRVIPNDAGPLLAAGRLDPRLFDVTELVRDGYDRLDQLPLLVTGGQGTTAAATGRSVSGLAGLTTTRGLPALNGVAVHQAHAKAAQSWSELTGGGKTARALRSGIGKVWLDGLRRPAASDASVTQIGAPTAWAAGYTGAGSTVAVLDSGIDGTHPDLTGQVVAQSDFTDGNESDADLSGHGTHVASIIAGTGAASGGQHTGAAPGAKLLDGKVCAVFGCADSWIVAGMDWAVADQHAKVVNLSLGEQDDPSVTDPVEAAVQALSDQYGTLFVAAAGNGDGDGGVVQGAVDSPGDTDAALTVGAVDASDALAGFSARGPTRDGRLKPDLTAPGVDITAARGKDATLVPGKPGDLYTTLSGTSMATAYVSGAAAILSQQHPDWTGPQLKAALMASADPNPAYGVYGQGAGRVDVARAIGQQVTASPADIGFPEQSWPHQDDPVLTRVVAYHNAGSAAESLALAMDTLNPDGTPTPAGMFTVSPASLTVPAGGDAAATVTVDTRVAGPDGELGGWLTATSGDQTVRTPVAVQKEVESYDVTLTHTYRAGTTPSYAYSELLPFGTVDTEYSVFDGGQGGSTVIRVPAGHYTVMSNLTSTTDAVLLAQPDLDVNQTMTVNLDAGLGKPISVTVPHAAARPILSLVSAQAAGPYRGVGMSVVAGSFASLYAAQIGPDAGTAGFTSLVGGQWAQVDANGSADNSPYLYSLLFPTYGRMVTDYRHAVTQQDLATVEADYAATQPGSTGLIRVFTGFAGTGSGFSGYPLSVSLPGGRTEYYNADPGVTSTTELAEYSGSTLLSVTDSAPNLAYRAGQTYRQRWNRGVFAPSLPAVSLLGWGGVTRTGDTIGIDVPMFSDGDGRPGSAGAYSLSSTLLRDGTAVGSSQDVRFATIDVGPDAAAYQLRLTAERTDPLALSSRIDVVWGLSSGHVGGTTPVALPLWTARFSPELDRYDTAAAGRVVRVPVCFTAQPGAVVGTLAGSSVEASFDDGVTWTTVPLRNGVAQVPDPRGSGFVSLRATAADSAGDTVTETIIHAYRYGTVR